MKKIIIATCVLIANASLAQNIDKIINAKEVERVETILASDEMKGRKTFSPEIDKAADFIADEFKKTGLKALNNSSTYLQEFFMYQPFTTSVHLVIDGKEISDSFIAVTSFQAKGSFTEKSNIEIVKINAGDNFRQKITEINASTKNLLVLLDPSFNTMASRYKQGGRMQQTQKDNSVIYVFGVTDAKTFTVDFTTNVVKKSLKNVVGFLPGKSKPNEYVIFSGHYDHLGIGRAVNGDSIYNGANDDAAGTTAVVLLAKYFKALNNNERTLVFATFTAEEVGGYGSQYFSKQFDAAQVMAMFNLEMIGTESKWGKNSAYITGYEKTDMGKILQSNLEGSAFTFYPDPYTTQNLFYRSDNATLARLGVPAHTISTSKMDSEPNYHKPSDEIGTLDMNNMAEIIKAIALSSRTIISGKDSPSRVDTKSLN
jgi:hypothetical protein